MTNRQIKEMMRDIDPQYQQKANARAAAVQHVPHRSRIPSLLVCGAAATCAVFAAAIILPRLKTEQFDIAASEAQIESAADSEYEVVTEPVEKVDFTGISSEGAIRFMAAAYAPYMLDISAEQQNAFALELAAAASVADIGAEDAGTVWQPCDPDMPYPDGENYLVYVYNDGDPYRMIAYSDNTVAFERGDSVERWQFPDGTFEMIGKYANPSQPDPNESYAENPLEGHLTWCAEDTLNAADIWKNTNVAAKEVDMTTKEGVFYKMSNTMDYYNRVSCVTVSGTRNGSPRFQATRSALRADLNAGKATEYLDYFYSADADALMNGCEGCDQDDSGTFTTAKDGEKSYHATEYNHACYVDPYITHRIDCPPVENDQRKPEQMEFDDYDFYNSRCQILDGMGLDSFEFAKLVLGYLYEFDKWDIVGTETVNGRTCVHIKGTVNSRCIFRDFVKDFDMYTDEATGAVVKLLGYNQNGELSHFVNTLNLAFEDDAEPVVQPDFSGYEIHEDTGPAEAVPQGSLPEGTVGVPVFQPVTDLPASDAPVQEQE